jgi:putative transposase
MDPQPHRKLVKHYELPGHAHLLTFSCYRRLPLLSNTLWRTWLSRSIDAALAQAHVALVAFVYMPEHVHLLVHPQEEEYRIGWVLFAIKRPFSFRVKMHLVERQSSLLSQLTIRTRPGVTAFRFWQEGPGHDRNLVSVENCVKAAEYLHGNPVRRGLVRTVDRWRWSSWRHYHRPADPPDPALPLIRGFPS